MSLKNAIDKLKYDARMVDINMKSQLITPADLKKQLEKLPDLKANSMEIELDSDDTSNGHDAN